MARLEFEMVEAALAGAGKRVVVVEEGEVADDLAQDLLEVLTSARSRLYGRRSARNRARWVLESHRMRVNQAFRFELDLNREKRVLLAKRVGAARFAYNWGLEHSVLPMCTLSSTTVE